MTLAILLGAAFAFILFILCDIANNAYQSMEWWIQYGDAVKYYRNVAAGNCDAFSTIPSPFSAYYKGPEHRFIYEYLDDETIAFWKQ